MLSLNNKIKDIQLEKSEWLNFLWLELTERCNLRCQHCYVSSGPDLPLYKRMTHNNWLKVIHDASKLGCKSLQFIGGEPMLYPHLEELIIAARDNGMEYIEIYTNGTPLSDKWVRKLHDYNINVACSVYASEAHIHDAVTQISGSFNRTIAALQRLVQSNVQVRVGFIEMDVNAGAFDETRQFLSNLGINNVKHDFTRGFGRAEKPVKRDNPFDGLCGQCWKGSLCITSSGDAYPCIMSRSFRIGNVIEDGLVRTLNSNALQSFRLDMKASNAFHLASMGDCNPKTCPPDAGGDCRPMICSPTDPDPDPGGPSSPCPPVGGDISICGPNLGKPGKPVKFCGPNLGKPCGPNLGKFKDDKIHPKHQE